MWPALSTDERRQVIASMVEAVPRLTRPSGHRAHRAGHGHAWKGDAVPVARPARGRRKRSEVEAEVVVA